MTVRPGDAFALIEERDIQLSQRCGGHGYWCVALWRLASDEKITLDHIENIDFERLCLQGEAARYLRAHHPIGDMRAIYDECIVHLDHELRRRAA